MSTASSSPSPSPSPSPGDYIGRFAPSPSGPLHFGSLVAAVASHVDARAHRGRWLVRIEDVDETRSKPQFADDILRTLAAFGLHADGEVVYQSKRKAAYEAALTTLSARAMVYACTCSRREIADSALSGIEGPVYPGTCRHARHGLEGNALRVLTHDSPLQFTDRVQGSIEQRLQSQLGDFVIKRRDGLFAYQLAVVVDDFEQHISHVVRGADLLDSSPRQIHLQQLLGLPTPQYLHIPLAVNEAGQKLSKQALAPGIGAGDALVLLQQALRFLGQTVDTAPSSPAALLDAAARNWSVAAIPRLRHRLPA